MSLSQLFEELKGWNSEFKLITHKSITGIYFDTMVAILDFVKMLSQLFEELEGLKSILSQLSPKYITGTYSDTKLSMFGLADLSMGAIVDFQMSISQLFEELQGLNLEFNQITPKSIH